MQKLLSSLLAILMLFGLSTTTWAKQDMSVGEQCFSEFKKQKGYDPNFIEYLKSAEVIAEQVRIHRYEEKIGTQLIRTVIHVPIEIEGKKIATVLCLDDLYYDFIAE